MSYRLQVRLASEADVAEAAQWYDQRQPGLGEKFGKLIRPSPAWSKILSLSPSFFAAMKCGVH
jgi:hypothetical protein